MDEAGRLTLGTSLTGPVELLSRHLSQLRRLRLLSLRPSEQLVDAAAVTLGRPSHTAFADGHRGGCLAWRRGRAVVDVTFGGHRCAHSLADDLRDNHYAFASVLAEPYLITGPHQVRPV